MKLRVFKVEGGSMLPSLFDKDYVITFRHKKTRYKLGDIVVVRHPELGIIIKRIVQLKEASVLLAGDNPASTSSERMGWQPCNKIIGKVVAHFPKRNNKASN